LRYVQTLRVALNHAQELTEAHELLADHFQAKHAQAESRRDPEAAARAAHMLQVHDRGKHQAWLDGRGALSLTTEPTGAEVLLYRYESQDRRLDPIFVRSLGASPIQRVPLEQGSWLCILRAPGHHDVRYPVHIDRMQH
jgi:serine/threonine-protein kinase